MASHEPVNEHNLTMRQERFTLHFFEHGVAVEAYRVAYEKELGAQEHWLHVEASQLLSNPDITLRLAALREQPAKNAVFNVSTAMDELDELDEASELAYRLGNVSGMVNATKGKMRLLRLDRPKKIELSSKLTVDPLAELFASIRKGGGTN